MGALIFKVSFRAVLLFVPFISNWRNKLVASSQVYFGFQNIHFGNTPMVTTALHLTPFPASVHATAANSTARLRSRKQWPFV
jgi:hypothetical protein